MEDSSPQRENGTLSPFLLCALTWPGHQVGVLATALASTKMCCPATGPKNMEPKDHGLNPHQCDPKEIFSVCMLILSGNCFRDRKLTQYEHPLDSCTGFFTGLPASAMAGTRALAPLFSIQHKENFYNAPQVMLLLCPPLPPPKSLL